MGMDLHIGARVPDELWMEVKRYAKERNMTTSEVIRKSLELYLPPDIVLGLQLGGAKIKREEEE